MGEQCGRVLSVLDSVIDLSNSVITRKRPFALWNDHARGSSYDTASSAVDEWGRSATFALAQEYHPDMKYSSKDVVNQGSASASSSSAIAASVLDEWVRAYWEIDNKMGRATSPKEKRRDFFFSTRAVDRWDSKSAYLQAALL